jgi:hypothetical protein
MEKACRRLRRSCVNSSLLLAVEWKAVKASSSLVEVITGVEWSS